MLMIEDMYIKTILEGFCAKLKAGIFCEEGREKIEHADKIRSVNAAILTECDFVPVTSPSIICLDVNGNILPELLFTIGDVVETFGNIIYGFYNFVPGNVSNPIAVHLADDIVAQASNYETEAWDPDVQLTLNIEYTGADGIGACYHVICMPLSAGPLTIKDATDLDVTAAWTVFTDATNTYYLLQVPIAVSDVTYKINE